MEEILNHLLTKLNCNKVHVPYMYMLDQRPLLYKGRTQIVASLQTIHLQYRSQIVASSFEAMSLHVAAILILVSTVAASYVAAC